MKTALLAQNEALEARELNPNTKKSMLPLSHTITFPVDVEGAIYPICCVEVVPTDSYKISNEILLRQLQPLKVPVMTKYTLNTAYFYCSNRLGWKKWSMFADQANKGRANVNYSFELPTVFNADTVTDGDEAFELFDYLTSSVIEYNGADVTVLRNINYKNSLHTYFNISHNKRDSAAAKGSFSNSDELPLAFPFFDYQMICRDFYTNIDRLSDNPSGNFYDFDDPFSDWAFSNLYPVDDDEVRLQDGPQIRSGFSSGDDEGEQVKGFVLDKIRYHDLRYDYFTSSLRAPMRGEAPTVDSTVAVSSIDVSEAITNLQGLTSDTTIALGVDTLNGNKLGAGALGENQENTNFITINDTATSYLKSALEKIKVNLQTVKKINAAEIILLNQLTLWQTLNMLHKPYYNDFLNAHFDKVHVGDSLAEKPMYIGGTSQVIDINEVLQTSQSTDSSKLGSQAAVAHSLSGSYVGSFFAQDYGFIIGVAYILPDLVYDPAMPRWASRRTIEDYYFPEFANLSMQATLNKELFFSSDDEWNNQPLGYVGAYDELRSIPNYCAGDLLNNDYQDLRAWILRHSMSNDNKPAINQRFLSAKGNVDMTAWTVPNAPKFMLQCANYIDAMRPMPYIAIPQIGN